MTEDEQKEKNKKLDQCLENCINIIKEIELKRKKEENEKKEISKSTQSQKVKETKQSQQIFNHSLYNSLKDSDFFRRPLTLLTELQEYDESQSYQKLMDLFLEENQTVSEILTCQTPSDYLILQLYTCLSLKSRKIYLNSYENEDENKKSILLLKALNNIKFNKDKNLTNPVFNFINHNILRLEDIYQNDETIENNIQRQKRSQRILQKEKELPILEAVEYKKREEISVKFDQENDDEKIVQGETIHLLPSNYNEKEVNEQIQMKKVNKIEEIIDMEDSEFEGMTKEEVDRLLREKYDDGEKRAFIESENQSENSSLNGIREYSDKEENEDSFVSNPDYFYDDDVLERTDKRFKRKSNLNTQSDEL